MLFFSFDFPTFLLRLQPIPDRLVSLFLSFSIHIEVYTWAKLLWDFTYTCSGGNSHILTCVEQLLASLVFLCLVLRSVLVSELVSIYSLLCRLQYSLSQRNSEARQIKKKNLWKWLIVLLADVNNGKELSGDLQENQRVKRLSGEQMPFCTSLSRFGLGFGRICLHLVLQALTFTVNNEFYVFRR